MEYCCDEWKKLTDTVYFEEKEGKYYIMDQEWRTSISDKPINYCPWCGTKVEPKEEDADFDPILEEYR
jgi:hypothetical protein